MAAFVAPSLESPFPATASSRSSNVSPASVLSLSTPSSSSSTPHFTSLSTNHSTCSVEAPELNLLLATFYSIFFILGLLGNLLALWGFMFLHSSRNSVRVFLINCAVADLVLLACLPFRVFYHLNHNQWGLGPVACKLVGNLFYMNMYISITLLGFISLDRFWRLRCAGRAQRNARVRLWGRCPPWSWVACGALWGLSLLGLAPMIIMAEDEQKSSNLCFEYRQRLEARGKAYFNMVLVLLFWLVFAMMVVSYASIASRLLQVSRDKPNFPNAQRYKRTAKKSFFVLFLFTVCFGPYHAFRPIYIMSQLRENAKCDEDLHFVHRTNEVMLLFSAFNSCLDPIMYFLLSGSVRKATFQALGRRFSNGLPFLNDVTTNSSSVEFRRPSVPLALPQAGVAGSSFTPRASLSVTDSTLLRT